MMYKETTANQYSYESIVLEVVFPVGPNYSFLQIC